jgi:hypothetical protein
VVFYNNLQYILPNRKKCVSLQREITHQNKTMSDRLYITEAIDLGGLKVRLVFSDGTNSTVDVGDYIRRHPHPQYNKYLDPKKFRTFTLDGGNIVWGRNWDLIFPIEQLHEGVIG